MTARAALLGGLATTLAITHARAEPNATRAQAEPGPGTARDREPGPGAARDREPDPAVQDAAEANLETTESRSGLTFTAAVGGGLTAGFGITDSVGRGGALSLRLGHVATRHTVITFELTGTASLHKAAMMSATKANTDFNFLAGAQYYVNRSLWLRAAGGLGVYTRRDVRGPTGNHDVTLVGPTALGGLGFELLRFKWAVLGLEFNGSTMISSDGLLIASAAGLDLAFD